MTATCLHSFSPVPNLTILLKEIVSSSPHLQNIETLIMIASILMLNETVKQSTVFFLGVAAWRMEDGTS